MKRTIENSRNCNENQENVNEPLKNEFDNLMTEHYITQYSIDRKKKQESRASQRIQEIIQSSNNTTNVSNIIENRNPITQSIPRSTTPLIEQQQKVMERRSSMQSQVFKEEYYDLDRITTKYTNGWIPLKYNTTRYAGCLFCGKVCLDTDNCRKHVLNNYSRDIIPIVEPDKLTDAKLILLRNYFMEGMKEAIELTKRFTYAHCSISALANDLFKNVFDCELQNSTSETVQNIPTSIPPISDRNKEISLIDTNEGNTIIDRSNVNHIDSILNFTIIPNENKNDDISILKQLYNDNQIGEITNSDENKVNLTDVNSKILELLDAYKTSKESNKLDLLAYSLVDLCVYRSEYNFDIVNYILQYLSGIYEDIRQKFITILWCDIATNLRLSQSQISVIHNMVRSIMNSYGENFIGSHPLVSSYMKEREAIRKKHIEALSNASSFTSISLDSTLKNQNNYYGAVERSVIGGYIIDNPLFVTTIEKGCDEGSKLADSIYDKLKNLKVDTSKISGTTVDGASNMIGHQNGLVSFLESKFKDNNHYENSHCAAHRENLSAKDLLNNKYFYVYHAFISTLSESAVRDKYEEFINHLKEEKVKVNVLDNDINKDVYEDLDILRKIPPLSNTRWLYEDLAGEIIVEQYDKIELFLKDDRYNGLFIKNFIAKIEAWEKKEKIKDDKKNIKQKMVINTQTNDIVTDEQMVVDNEEMKLRLEIEQREKEKEEKRKKAGSQKKEKPITIERLKIDQLFPGLIKYTNPEKSKQKMDINIPSFKHLIVMNAYIIKLLAHVNTYFQNACLFIFEIKEIIDSLVEFLSDIVKNNNLDINYWINSSLFESLKGRKIINKTIKNQYVRKRCWSPDKFNVDIYNKYIKGIIVDVIKYLKLRFTNPCFTWNMKSKKYTFNEDTLELEFDKTNFNSLKNYHLQKYLDILYIPQMVLENKMPSGKYSINLKREIDSLIEWLKINDYVISGPIYSKGTISEFIKRKKKYTLIDILDKAGKNNYPMLIRCVNFIVSLQPTTARVESLFSILKNTIEPNMDDDTLESMMMLKMNRCGAIRKIFK